jgi:hypothetical protein
MCCKGSINNDHPRDFALTKSFGNSSYKTKIRTRTTKVVRNACPPFTFIVVNVSKVGHPWEHRITTTNQAFAVNGERGKTLFLKRNSKYTFVFEQERNFETLQLDFALYFTTDPGGGPKGGKFPGEFDPPTYNPPSIPGTPSPFRVGTRSFVVDNSFPTVFYYQSKTDEFMGGIIFVTP